MQLLWGRTLLTFLVFRDRMLNPDDSNVRRLLSRSLHQLLGSGLQIPALQDLTEPSPKSVRKEGFLFPFWG